MAASSANTKAQTAPNHKSTMTDPTKLTFHTKARLTLTILTALTIASILNTPSLPNPEKSHARRLLQAEDEVASPTDHVTASRLLRSEPRYLTDTSGIKPIMSTFFEPVKGGCCGMTEEGHTNLVASWRRAWEFYGWETRILTEEDARKHPRFEELTKKLDESDVNGYNQRCFWRWLAMALDEDEKGGWMSD
jgi:hypothetical protein